MANSRLTSLPSGAKGGIFFRRRYGVAEFVEKKQGQGEGNDRAATPAIEIPARPRRGPEEKSRGERKNQIEVAGDYTGMLDKPSFDQVALLGREVVHRYMEEELDAVYLVYNEFKSVLAQRVVVERILPIMEVGRPDIKQAEEMKPGGARRNGAGRRILRRDSTGSGPQRSRTGSKKIRHCGSGLHL